MFWGGNNQKLVLFSNEHSNIINVVMKITVYTCFGKKLVPVVYLGAHEHSALLFEKNAGVILVNMSAEGSRIN